MDAQQLLLTIWPLILLQVVFQIYALVDLHIIKKHKTKNITPLIWTIIIIFGEILGPIAYFIFGRSEE